MRIIVSTVSHDHTEMIEHLGGLKTLAEVDEVVVLCRDNLSDNCLRNYCLENNIIYLRNESPQGFAANNNLNFRYYLENLCPNENDYFLLLNPDVELLPETIPELKVALSRLGDNLLAGNLFLERTLQVVDDNIRHYPKFSQFIKTYLFSDRTTMIDRKSALPADNSYWASCAFLALQVKHYIKLKGLDERFYMYCEDIDFSRRAHTLGLGIIVAEQVKALHWRQRASKKLFSRFFIWHVLSVLKYCFFSKKNQYESLKSCFPLVSESPSISISYQEPEEIPINQISSYKELPMEQI